MKDQDKKLHKGGEKKITDVIPKEEDMVKIGKMRIGQCIDYPDGSKSVWLEIQDGEGGQFPAKDVAKILRDYFNKNF